MLACVVRKHIQSFVSLMLMLRFSHDRFELGMIDEKCFRGFVSYHPTDQIFRILLLTLNILKNILLIILSIGLRKFLVPVR